MFVWTSLIGGPLVMPLALWFRTDVPELIAEAMLLAGVVGMFLAICATEAVDGGERTARASSE